jgi:glycosyltransferase involved in cell wall biosynthesis
MADAARNPGNTKPMICFFNTTKAWGGGEKWHFDMAARLHADGIAVIAVTHTRSELRKKFEQQGINTFSFDISNLSFLNPVKILRLKNFFVQKQIKTLLLNLPADLKVAGMAAKLAGVERIIYRRGSAIPIRNSPLNRLLFGKIITHVLVNSNETKRTILANNPNLIHPSKITVIYNGLKLAEFPPSSTLPHASRRQKQPHDHPVILGNLGRLEAQKAQHLLIELGIKLKKAGFDFKIKIGGEGRLKTLLGQKIKDAGLEDLIRLTGFVNDPAAFMQEIDIFVLTSHWEGFGFVIAEAMACEKPVVAFHHSSNPELVEQNITGFLVEPANMDDLFNKTAMLIKDEKLRRKMGKAGRKKVEKAFDFEKNYRKVKRFLLDNPQSP